MESVSGGQLNIEVDNIALPVLSTVATEALALINTGEATPQDLEVLIRKDQSLASRILQLANSPLYTGRVGVSSIGQAVVRLGLTRLKNTILIASTGDVFDHTDRHARALWQHSIAVALASVWLSERLEISQPDECFVAGMLHDIGKVVIYNQEPEAYGDILDGAARAQRRIYQYEKKRISYFTHETIGGLVAIQWELSLELVEPIRFHHAIEEDADAVGDLKPLVALVSAANLLINRLGHGGDRASSGDPLDWVPGRIIGLDETAVDAFDEEMPAIIREQADSFI